MKNRIKPLLLLVPAAVLIFAAASSIAGYKAKPWRVNARENYPASLTSEGVTIAVQPLFSDALAAKAFDKKDIVTSGIMPLEILIFNDNDYAIEVDGLSIELICGKERLRTLRPKEVVVRLYGRSSNDKALEDFDKKFLMNREVPPHAKNGGFLYIRAYNIKDLLSCLSKAVVYVPNVYRQDEGSRLIFFEVSLESAMPDPGGR